MQKCLWFIILIKAGLNYLIRCSLSYKRSLQSQHELGRVWSCWWIIRYAIPWNGAIYYFAYYSHILIWLIWSGEMLYFVTKETRMHIIRITSSHLPDICRRIYLPINDLYLFNSLALLGIEWNLRWIIHQLTLVIDGWGILLRHCHLD